MCFQHTCAQIFSHKNGFAVCYLINGTSGDSIGESLYGFVHYFGAPSHLNFDGHLSQVGRHTKFNKGLRKFGIGYHISSPQRSNENPAESCIREVKRRFFRILTCQKVPMRLWDYLMIWISETGSLLVFRSKFANGRISLELITGETPDISEYLHFGFYDQVVFRNNAGLEKSTLGRWLGVSHKIGQLMVYWVLLIGGKPISCVTV